MEIHMKTRLILACLFLFASPAYSAEARTILTCQYTGPLLGAPQYSLMVEDSDGGPNRYYLALVPQNPMADIHMMDVPAPVRYGNAWIVTRDMGRSGYAHLYSNGKTTVIDINLFQAGDRGLNTSGPQTDYECK